MFCILAHLTNPAQPRVEADVVTHRLVMCGSSINHYNTTEQNSSEQLSTAHSIAILSIG